MNAVENSGVLGARFPRPTPGSEGGLPPADSILSIGWPFAPMVLSDKNRA